MKKLTIILFFLAASINFESAKATEESDYCRYEYGNDHGEYAKCLQSSNY